MKRMKFRNKASASHHKESACLETPVPSFLIRKDSNSSLGSLLHTSKNATTTKAKKAGQPWWSVPLVYYERTCHLVFSQWIDWIIKYAPFTETIMTYTTLYMGLQVIGLLWGFVVNVLGQLALVLGSLSFYKKEESVVHVVATLYVIWSIVRILIVFARFLWRLSWESLTNFPTQRKMVLLDRNGRQVMVAILGGMLFMTTSSIVIPYLCNGDNKFQEIAALQHMCSRPWSMILWAQEFKQHRILKLTINIGLVQWLQFLLYEIPDWSRAFAKKPIIAAILSLLVVVLMGATLVWAVDWLADNMGVNANLIGSLTGLHISLEIAELGLLSAWMWFYMLLVSTAEWQPKPSTAAQDRLLVPVFKKFKYTLLAMLCGQFIKSSVHAHRGFLMASEDMLATGTILPTIYVLMHSFSDMLMRSSWPLMVLSLMLGSSVAFLACSFSGIVGPMTFILVAINFTSKSVKEYGRHHLYKDVVLDSDIEHLPWIDYRTNVNSSTEGSPDLKPVKDTLLSVDKSSQVSKGERSRMIAGTRMVIKMLMGVSIIFGLVVMLLSSLAAMQKTAGWFPHSVTVEESEQYVKVNHTQMINLKLHKNLTNTNYEVKHGPLKAAPYYSICGSTWENLTILDFAFFSEAAYFDGKDKLEEVLGNFFPGNSPSYEIRMPPINMTRGGVPQFFEAYNKEKHMSIIAVRGTDIGRVEDIIEDIRLWTEPVVYTILTWVFPMMRIWPNRLVALLVESYHECLGLIGLRSDNWYYNSIVSYVDNITDTDPTRSVIITGHSLGGGMARITGYLTGRASIVFSAPGIYHSYRKIRQNKMFATRRTKDGEHVLLDQHALHHKTVNVVPENDIIAQIDAQAGMVQNIRCHHSEKMLQISCHMLESTICEIIARCGDARNRFSKCEYTQNVSNLLPVLWVYLEPMVSAIGLIIVLLIIKFTMLPLL